MTARCRAQHLSTLSATLLLLLLAAVLGAALGAPAARAASGDLLKWAPLYIGLTTDRDAIFDAAPGPGGSLYLCGLSDQSQANGRIYLAKYDASRNMVWQTAFLPPGAVSAGSSYLAVDSAGSVVVAGSMWDGAQSDLVVVKFDPDGALIWSAVRNGTGTYGGAGGLAVAADGSVYVADVGWGGPQLDVVRYDADADPAHPFKGLERWARTLAGGGASPAIDAYDIALDGAGSVYLAGGRSSVSAERDAFILKLSPAGKRRWLRTWDGSGHGSDDVEHLVVKGTRVYAAGNTESKSRQADMVLLSYDTAGHRRWVRTWDDGVRQPDNVGDLQVDGSGNAYAACNAWLSSGRQKVFLCKFAPSGRKLWQRGYRGVTDDGGPNASGLAVSKAGDAWMSGYLERPGESTQFLTIKWTARGSRRWANAWDGPPIQPLGGQAWGCILSGTSVVTYGELFTETKGSGTGLTWRSR